MVVLSLAALIGLGLNTYGQNEPDTSKIRVGNKKYTVIVDGDKEVRILNDKDTGQVVKERQTVKHKKPAKRMDGMWDGLEFGLTNFINSDYQLYEPDVSDIMNVKVANSWGFNFNFAEKSFGIIRNYFGLVTGLGLEYQRYMFDNDLDLIKTESGIDAVTSEFDLTKNRLSIWHLNLPLMAEFQIPVYGEHNFIKISAGVVGGLRIGSRQVQKYMVGDDTQKIKTKGDFYLRDFRYGFTARVGYGDVALFGTLYPQTLFKDCKGPEIFPVTIGLHIGG